MAPTVSAIMPVYNGERYVAASIESVINQTLPPVELIVIDDASKDKSVEVVKAIKAPFPIVLLHQPNKRQSAARNLAATQAKGEFLAFIDHDDIWAPMHLEKLAAPLVNDSRMGWTYSDIDEIDSEGNMVALQTLRTLHPGVQHPKVDIFNLLAADMFIFPSAAMVRKKAMDEVGGFDERLSGYEDDDFFLRVFRAGWLNAFIPEALVRYRRHPTSSAFSDRMWKSRDIYASKLIDMFPDDRELVRYYIRDIIAPRFYGAAVAEYHRHFPHQRWDQCELSVKLMRRFAVLMKTPIGWGTMKRSMRHGLWQFPRTMNALYPLLRKPAALPLKR